MNSKWLIMLLALIAVFANPLFAHEGHDHDTQIPEMLSDEISENVHFGNKICPISGEEIGSMGEGIEVEHEGVVYKVCCKMCEKDFLKDPEKYIEKLNKQTEEME